MSPRRRIEPPTTIGGALQSLLGRYVDVDAPTLRAYGHDAEAANLERLVREVRDALVADGETAVSLTEAEQLSGYSRDHLARLVRQGAIPNAGRPNAPRIRRADLPRRGPRSSSRGAASGNLENALASLSTISRELVAAKLPRDRRG